MALVTGPINSALARHLPPRLVHPVFSAQRMRRSVSQRSACYLRCTCRMPAPQPGPCVKRRISVMLTLTHIGMTSQPRVAPPRDQPLRPAVQLQCPDVQLPCPHCPTTVPPLHGFSAGHSYDRLHGFPRLTTSSKVNHQHSKRDTPLRNRQTRYSPYPLDKLSRGKNNRRSTPPILQTARHAKQHQARQTF